MYQLAMFCPRNETLQKTRGDHASWTHTLARFCRGDNRRRRVFVRHLKREICQWDGSNLTRDDLATAVANRISHIKSALRGETSCEQSDHLERRSRRTSLTARGRILASFSVSGRCVEYV